MVAVHTVPRDAAHLRRVDLAPFAVPLLVLCIKNTTGVKGITNVDHKLYIPKFLEGLIHFVRNRLLAKPWSNISMCHWIPAPVTQHQEGCNATVRTVRTVRWSWWIAEAGIADHQAEETAQPKPGAVDHDAGAANFEQLWAERLAAAAAHTVRNGSKQHNSQLSQLSWSLRPRSGAEQQFFETFWKACRCARPIAQVLLAYLCFPLGRAWKRLEEHAGFLEGSSLESLKSYTCLKQPRSSSTGVFRSSTRDSSLGG